MISRCELKSTGPSTCSAILFPGSTVPAVPSPCRDRDRIPFGGRVSRGGGRELRQPPRQDTATRGEHLSGGGKGRSEGFAILAKKRVGGEVTGGQWGLVDAWDGGFRGRCRRRVERWRLRTART